ncbi:hypothetical protein SADUNF_Sadunf15G0121700 [Salix dunnii]|uniref:Uncharacterized protein n=1 Tax=Salix dunnii TaxID=1413687 RepID=A0A835JFE8_9ROSI|nr:hypothetical protein SADUNF_Sadunf15G0121700 [Salix dunnii]
MVREHDTNNNPWIRVNDFAQHRDTSGSAKPNRDFSPQVPNLEKFYINILCWSRKLNLMIRKGKKIVKESSSSIVNQDGWSWPTTGTQLQEIINNLRSLRSSTPSCIDITPHNDAFHTETSTDIGEPTALNSMRRLSC